jgi:hypothetical protein
LYEASEDCSKAAQWRQRFPDYNAANLETQGVLDIKNCPYTFVNHNHPVISLLKTNPEKLSGNLETYGQVDNEWYKVTRDVMSNAVQTLRTKVLTMVPTQNLGTFSLQLHRLAGT